jgi:hypothetical protein
MRLLHLRQSGQARGWQALHIGVGEARDFETGFEAPIVGGTGIYESTHGSVTVTEERSTARTPHAGCSTSSCSPTKTESSGSAEMWQSTRQVPGPRPTVVHCRTPARLAWPRAWDRLACSGRGGHSAACRSLNNVRSRSSDPDSSHLPRGYRWIGVNSSRVDSWRRPGELAFEA